MFKRYFCIFIIFSIFFIINLLLVSCGPSDKKEKTSISFEIIKEIIYDTPLKVQLERHILVPKTMNKDSLRNLLLRQFEELKNKHGFKYHENPTNIYIYVYDDKDKAKAEQFLWIGMLQYVKFTDKKPKIIIREIVESNENDSDKIKFGKTEAQRQVIFKEIVSAERRATEEALKFEKTNIEKQLKKEKELNEKFKSDIAQKYNITIKELGEIGMEGIKKLWIK